MRGLGKKAKTGFGALLVVLAGVAIGAAGFDRLKDHVKIGGGLATDKVLEFDIGDGASNPKITADGSTGLISFANTGGLAPVGAVISFAGSSAPTGWLLCDGSAVSRTTYAALFAAVGTTYGVGDGTTTFNLPDIRGRAVAGKDDMGGSAASRLTNAASGITGTTLGAAGGAQQQTPAGSVGGSQSIAHTHNIAHAHQWGYIDTFRSTRTNLSLDDTTTAIPTSGVGSRIYSGSQHTAGSGNYAQLVDETALPYLTYTTGALSPPSGSDGATAASGAMSANATVSGSNFTFTGTAATNAQPTIVLNYLIKS